MYFHILAWTRLNVIRELKSGTLAQHHLLQRLLRDKVLTISCKPLMDGHREKNRMAARAHFIIVLKLKTHQRTHPLLGIRCTWSESQDGDLNWC